MAAGGVAAALVGPHALCILGLAGVSTMGALGLSKFCGHGESEADSSHGVELRRVETMPDTFTEFSEQRNHVAQQVLFESEPRFKEIFDAKQKEAGEEPVKVVFLKLEDDAVHVVLCKNGAFCPCSKPQVYEIGSKFDVLQPEKYKGHHQILKALYDGQ
jgi:hypothetical protein